MEWVANPPIRSTIDTRLSVHDYETDLCFDFDLGELVVKNGDLATVCGLDNFIQKVKRFILTPHSEGTRYGFSHRLFEVANKTDFAREAQNLAEQMVSQTLMDSTPENPNGLGHTIEEIQSIKRITANDKDFLIVQMLVTGLDEPLMVSVPYPKR